jgi:hypothetical protein
VRFGTQVQYHRLSQFNSSQYQQCYYKILHNNIILPPPYPAVNLHGMFTEHDMINIFCLNSVLNYPYDIDPMTIHVYCLTDNITIDAKL